MDERREHRRLVIRLPIECHAAGGSRDALLRATTRNISTGGLYFEVELPEGGDAPAPADMLDVDLTVPPGDGHFPYEGRIRSTVEVLRRDELTSPGASESSAARRLGIAARFCEPLKYEF